MNMTHWRSIGIAFLIFLANGAAADWLPLEGNEDLDVYVDPETRFQEGDTVRIMALFNYKKPGYAHGLAYRSSLMQDEYDCSEEKRRRLYLSAYSQPMAQGKIVLRNRAPGDWKPVIPESVGERLFRTACPQHPVIERNEQAVNSVAPATP
jgi:hypothetical protein